MKYHKIYTYLSWIEEGERAIALCHKNWFSEAINCCRDGDMGEKDEDGVYERKWYEDEVVWDGVTDLRPANTNEIALYLKKVDLVQAVNGEHVTDIIYGNATHVVTEVQA